MFDEGAEIVMGDDERLRLVSSPQFGKRENHVHVVNADRSIGDVKCITYIDHDFRAWLVRGVLNRDTTVSMTVPGRLGLFFNLGEDVDCSLGGFHKGLLATGLFNMSFSPEIKVQCTLNGGRNYVFLGLDMTSSYLENLDALPILSEFLTQVKNGGPALLSQQGFYISNEAKSFISEIMMEMGRGVVCQRMHMSTLLHGLVEKSLGQAGKEYDMEAILFDQVRTYIYGNLPTVTVVSISDKLHISPLSLRALIKKKTTMKPVSFIIDCRMQKGMLLLSQGARLSEIAKRIGYSDQSAFSKAFLKKFGKWPTEMRGKLNDLPPAPAEHQFLLY